MRDLTADQRAEEEGRDAAVLFSAFLDDATLAHAHEPVTLLEGLTTTQEAYLPDSPYQDILDDLHDEWNTGFWQALEEQARVRQDAAKGWRTDANVDTVELAFEYYFTPAGEMDDDSLLRNASDMLYEWLQDGNYPEVGVNALITRP